MSAIETSVTGTSGGKNNEEEAFEQLMAKLLAGGQAKPVLFCGWRAYSAWVEILCGTSLVTRGSSADGRGAHEFKIAAEKSGKIAFALSKETVNTRSAMAWQVTETPVRIFRSTALSPDEVMIHDMAAVRGTLQ